MINYIQIACIRVYNDCQARDHCLRLYFRHNPGFFGCVIYTVDMFVWISPDKPNSDVLLILTKWFCALK